MSYQIIQGDTAPSMRIDASQNGATASFPSGTTAVLRWRKPDGTVTEGVSLTPIDVTIGAWQRDWSSGDTDSVGTHEAQLVVTFPSGKIETFPSSGEFVTWTVNPKLV